MAKESIVAVGFSRALLPRYIAFSTYQGLCRKPLCENVWKRRGSYIVAQRWVLVGYDACHGSSQFECVVLGKRARWQVNVETQVLQARKNAAHRTSLHRTRAAPPILRITQSNIGQ